MLLVVLGTEAAARRRVVCIDMVGAGGDVRHQALYGKRRERVELKLGKLCLAGPLKVVRDGVEWGLILFTSQLREKIIALCKPSGILRFLRTQPTSLLLCFNLSAQIVASVPLCLILSSFKTVPYFYEERYILRGVMISIPRVAARRAIGGEHLDLSDLNRAKLTLLLPRLSILNFVCK